MNIEISKERMLEMAKKLASMDFCPEQRVFYKNILRMVKADTEGRLLVLPNKLAPAMAAMDGDQGAIFDALEQAIREALEGLKSLEWNGEENDM